MFTTAISLKSESGDDYLFVSTYTKENEIIDQVKEVYGEEFPYLYVVSVVISSTVFSSATELENKLTEAIEKTQGEVQ